MTQPETRVFFHAKNSASKGYVKRRACLLMLSAALVAACSTPAPLGGSQGPAAGRAESGPVAGQWQDRRFQANNDGAMSARIELDQAPVQLRTGDQQDDARYRTQALNEKYIDLLQVARLAPPRVDGAPVQATNVVIRNKLAYVSFNLAGEKFRGAVTIVDVSNPLAPVLKAELLLKDMDVHTLALDDDGRLYLGGARDPDASGSASPSSLDAFELGRGGTSFARHLGNLALPSFGVTDIAFIGDRLYASVGAKGGGICRIDARTLRLEAFTPMEDARGLSVWGKDKLVALQGTPGRLHHFDNRHRLKKTLAIPGLKEPFHKSMVQVSGSTAYVAAADGGFLEINLGTGRLIRQIVPPGKMTTAVSVQGNFAFLGNGEDGLAVARLGNEGTARPVGDLLLPEGQAINMVRYQDPVVFLANGGGGLTILSSRPAPPLPSPVPTPLPTPVPTLPPGPPPADAIQADLWPHGAKAAVSFTDDEAFAEPYELLMPEVERRGWRMSFFICTEEAVAYETWPLMRQAHLNGHEVSAHTHTHPDMTRLSDAQRHEELALARDLLRRHVDPGLSFQSFAYPYELTDASTWNIVKQYHRYARAGDQGVSVPPNPVPINPARHPDMSALTAKANTREYPVSEWNRWIDATVAARGWFIEEWHGVTDGTRSGGWEPRTMDEFRAHFDHLAAYGKELWIDTMGKVASYIEKRDETLVKVSQWDSQGIRATLTDSVPEPAMAVDLSFTVRLPQGWTPAKVRALQGTAPLAVQPVAGRQDQVRLVVRLDRQAELQLLPQ